MTMMMSMLANRLSEEQAPEAALDASFTNDIGADSLVAEEVADQRAQEIAVADQLVQEALVAEQVFEEPLVNEELGAIDAAVAEPHVEEHLEKSFSCEPLAEEAAPVEAAAAEAL